MILLDLPLGLALVSLTLQLATATAMFLIARAPGWERVRVFGFVALTAAVYSTFDAMTSIGPHSMRFLGFIIGANLTVAATHAVAWLWYTYGDETGSWSGLPRWARVVGISLVSVVGSLSLAGFAAAQGTSSRLTVPMLGVDQLQPDLSVLGSLAAAAILITLGVSLAEYVRRARRGAPGAFCIALGFALFGLFAVEEALVSAGVVNFIYLADVGYICVVAPVTVGLFQRFAAHARRLSDMSSNLAGQVQQRTHERDDAIEALAEQRRPAALAAIAGGVGHEINNPLQYLLFSLDEMRTARAGAQSHVHDDALANAFDGAERIRRVVERLRTYAHPDRDAYSDVDVDGAVRAALRVAAPQLRGAGAVHVRLASSAMARGDESQLVQAVTSILVNAAQAVTARPVRASSAITVTTELVGDERVDITVADNGPGFHASVRGRLGEPYVTTRGDDGGLGLGLFVARGTVDGHGGQMHFECALEGGALVRIQLPATGSVPERSDAPGNAPGADAPGAGCRVLLVDDDAPVRRILARGLARLGYAVTTAADGLEGLALAEAHPFDVVVTDLMMPRMSGVEFAAALAERRPGLRRRLIVITGGATTPAAEAFIQSSGLAVLSKPVELSTLASEIERSAQLASA